MTIQLPGSARDPSDAAIASAVISMARVLDLDVVAEGIETADQLGFLRERECYGIQGYYFSPPVPAGEMERILRRPEEFVENWIRVRS